ncbi:acylpyruvase FAHD1, mitochondrial-like [Panonychus citri]|uniref:acylpyruvase FAHD1, mitochondrial-like n=1 Tax=Panonychus citri TaxID=50023 RepID=UPI002307BB30|nr:acylpyruvase FAHD1, mitochondrial-like [Panonychus citri]
MRLINFVEFSRKIVGVGRNYLAHVKEMKYANKPESPIIFLKPPSSFAINGSSIKYPKGCSNLQHEVELAIVIGSRGSDITENTAWDHVGGYTIALDMTARDWQSEAKEKGLPWSRAKGSDTFCPVGNFIPKEKIADIENQQIWCKVNGQMRQDGNTKDMIFKIPFLISHISSFFTLEPGDVILTGSPGGTGSVKPGDTIEIGLSDLVKASFPIIAKQ